MPVLAEIIAFLSTATNALPVLSALGVNIADTVSNARSLISGQAGTATADELAAATKACDDLEAAFNARVDELGKLAPES